MSSESGNITESIVEQVALDWRKGLGYEVLAGLGIMPGKPAVTII